VQGTRKEGQARHGRLAPACYTAHVSAAFQGQGARRPGGRFGSAIDSVDATSPPVALRYRDADPRRPITLDELQSKFSIDHFPGQGSALCEAYERARAGADCVVQFSVETDHAFDGYLEFFAAHGLK